MAVKLRPVPEASVEAGDLSFGPGRSELRGYLARPPGDGPFAGVLVIPEVFGLDEHQKSVARRFAAAGYAALAFDLWSRTGLPRDLTLPEAIRAAVASIPDGTTLDDLTEARRFLESEPYVERGHVGSVGFCVGGIYSFLFACRDPQLRCAVSFYGRLRYREGEKSDRKPADPLDRAYDLFCPWLGLFGAEDASIPAEHIEKMRAILTSYRKSFEIEVYSGAGHGFLNDTRPSFHPEAAGAAWARCLDFLFRRLVR